MSPQNPIDIFRDTGPAKGRGVIVNVASMLGHIGLPRSVSNTAYVASKHAVVGLTKTDGSYYARDNIRINAMCPGYVATPLLKMGAVSGALKEVFDNIPLGRLATMEEIGESICFLLSPMSSYMIGASLIADG